MKKLSFADSSTKALAKGALALRGARLLAGLLAVAAALAGAGCLEGGFTDSNVPEGERCNPLDSHDECADGLVCTGQGSSPSVPFCPENYCCAVDGNGNITSTSAFCQPGCAGGAASICAAAMAGNASADFDACVFIGVAEAGSAASSGDAGAADE